MLLKLNVDNFDPDDLLDFVDDLEESLMYIEDLF